MKGIATGVNRQGIIFKEYELDLLYQVYKHRLLTTVQMYRLIGGDKVIHYNSFSRRLRKFAKYDLLVSHEYSLGQNGFYYYYFRIGSKAIEILKDTGFIKSGEKVYEPYKISGVKNIDHYLATQEVVINTLVSLKERGKERVDSLAPYEYLYVDADDDNEDTKVVVPDWILKKDDMLLNIELDTGSENLDVIQDKVKRYIHLAELRPTERIIVLFVVLDDSFPSRFSYTDRLRRVGNMKQNLVNTKGIQSVNLDVFVVPLSRAYETAQKLVINEAPLLLDRRSLEVEACVSLLSEYNEKFEYNLSEVNQADFYNQSIPFQYYADGIYKLSNQKGTFTDYVMFVVLEEGNVQSLDRLDFLHKSAFHFNSFNEKVNRIIVLYDSLTSFESDILGAEFAETLFIDSQTLGSSLEDEPQFHKTISPYRMEGTTYDKGR
ncbi:MULTISPECIES: replication-relaxation family protein [Metabacillus]|uniref:replication-relaxation family protein n=1 Tax=Metabacillus TaxID=2675233 RepID=UPI000C8101BE|nr:MULTISPECIES: replication-relaxation family protein [Metabacillus]MCM3443590.1 replication-relaxation family protein [Metabacillus halosaccharovorans]PMC34250.1 hypothetical protein CJ195_24340 [Bacillus sp. UMB0899]